MRTRLFPSLVLLPVVAGCAGVPRVFVVHGDEGRTVYVWRLKGDEVVGVERYTLESPTTEHPTRSVIRAESATVEPPRKPRPTPPPPLRPARGRPASGPSGSTSGLHHSPDSSSTTARAEELRKPGAGGRVGSGGRDDLTISQF